MDLVAVAAPGARATRFDLAFELIGGGDLDPDAGGGGIADGIFVLQDVGRVAPSSWRPSVTPTLPVEFFRRESSLNHEWFTLIVWDRDARTGEPWVARASSCSWRDGGPTCSRDAAPAGAFPVPDRPGDAETGHAAGYENATKIVAIWGAAKAATITCATDDGPGLTQGPVASSTCINTSLRDHSEAYRQAYGAGWKAGYRDALAAGP